MVDLVSNFRVLCSAVLALLALCISGTSSQSASYLFEEELGTYLLGGLSKEQLEADFNSQKADYDQQVAAFLAGGGDPAHVEAFQYVEASTGLSSDGRDFEEFYNYLFYQHGKYIQWQSGDLTVDGSYGGYMIIPHETTLGKIGWGVEGLFPRAVLFTFAQAVELVTLSFSGITNFGNAGPYDPYPMLLFTGTKADGSVVQQTKYSTDPLDVNFAPGFTDIVSMQMLHLGTPFFEGSIHYYTSLTTIEMAPVPAPASLPLLLAGTGALATVRRRARRF